MSAVVIAPAIPLYQQGALFPSPYRHRHARRHAHLIEVPRIPLHQLGYIGADAAKIVGASAPIAATATAAVISSVAAGSAMASWAGPIGAGVGALVGLIAGLLAGHEQRKKQAQNENSAMNIGVQGFDSDLKQINQAFKAGQISAADALNAVNQVLMPGYWTVVGGQIQPGRNGCNTGASCPPPSNYKPGQNPCTGNIGAACCVGCFDLLLSVTQPDGILAAIQGQSTAPGGRYVANITEVYGSKYGGQQRNAYTVDWTPPASALATAGSGLVQTVESALGIPSSGAGAAAGGGSNLFLIGALIVGALVLFK